MSREPELVRWELPFADVSFPAVWIIGSEDGDPDTLTVAVAPDGINRYPKYLLRFDYVRAFKTEDEEQWGGSYFDFTLTPEAGCAFLQRNGSHWWKAFGEQMRVLYDQEPMHYLLSGGDNIVQVFAAADPDLEKVTESKTLTLEYAL